MTRFGRVGAISASAFAAGVSMLAGCGFSGLSFVSDDRLHFTSPPARSLVNLPVTLTWRMKGFQFAQPGSAPPSGHAGYFAVFIDRAPVKPGQTLLTIADRLCRRTPGCFNTSYLAVRGIYTTLTDSVTVSQLNLTDSRQKIQHHEATVVLIDTAGKRIGESAWYIDFQTDRPGS